MTFYSCFSIMEIDSLLKIQHNMKWDAANLGGNRDMSTETLTPWSQELSNPSVQDALTALIQKLPQINEAVAKMEQGIGVISAMAMDTQTFNNITEPISQISKVALNKENVEALASIADKLPRIAQSLELLEKVVPLLDSVAQKENWVAMADLVEVLAAPVTERVQGGMSIVKEAKERSERNTSTVSIFGALKLLKDPLVQDGLKFIQALLEVSNEKRKA